MYRLKNYDKFLRFYKNVCIKNAGKYNYEGGQEKVIIEKIKLEHKVLVQNSKFEKCRENYVNNWSILVIYKYINIIYKLRMQDSCRILTTKVYTNKSYKNPELCMLALFI